MTKINLLISIFVLLLSGIPANAQNANVEVRAEKYPAGDLPVDVRPARSTVRGRVFYENTGRAVRRAPIMLMSKGGGPREVTGLTDNNGFFEIKNVAAGTYYAMVNAPGVVSPIAYADLSSSMSDGFDEAVENFEPIVVNGVNDTEVQVAAKQGGAITGRIMYSDGDPAIGVKVEVLRRVEDRFLPVIPNFSSIILMFTGGGGFQTDDRGVYRFSGLPAGEYIVKVSENVSHSNNASRDSGPMGALSQLFGGFSLLTLYYPDVFESEKARVIDVAAGQELYEINLTIPDRRLYVMAGRIISGKDRSAIVAKVAIKRNPENAVSVFARASGYLDNLKTDEQGNWGFKEMPPGTYQLIIEPVNEWSDYDDDIPWPESNSAKPNLPAGPQPPKYAKKIQEITITDSNLSELVIELGYGATISGTVVTENSKEMPEIVNVSVTSEGSELAAADSVYNLPDEIAKPGSGDYDKYSSNSARRSGPKTSKISHDFKIENAPVGKAQFIVKVDDESFYVKSATLGNADILGRPLELNEGDHLKNVRVVIAKDVGTVKGTVQDAAKQPAANRKFALVPMDSNRRRVSTFYRYIVSDSDGEFTARAAPGEYAIVIFDQSSAERDLEAFYEWLDTAVKDAEKVTVKPGETSTVTLTMR